MRARLLLFLQFVFLLLKCKFYLSLYLHLYHWLELGYRQKVFVFLNWICLFSFRPNDVAISAVASNNVVSLNKVSELRREPKGTFARYGCRIRLFILMYPI